MRVLQFGWRSMAGELSASDCMQIQLICAIFNTHGVHMLAQQLVVCISIKASWYHNGIQLLFNMKDVISNLLIMTCLLGLIHATSADWQAAGNMSESNLTNLWRIIDTTVEQNLDYDTVARNISEELNALWDPAWNVVVCWLSSPYDYSGMVYGYAFRGHWFWINNFGPNHMSYIIWKDYNCNEWQEFNTEQSNGWDANNYTAQNPQETQDLIRQQLKNTFILGQTTLASRITPTQPYQDIWILAKSVSDAHLFLNQSVLSIVLFQKLKLKWSSYFCIGNLLWYSSDFYQYQNLSGGNQSFSYLMFETRILPQQ